MFFFHSIVVCSSYLKNENSGKLNEIKIRYYVCQMDLLHSVYSDRPLMRCALHRLLYTGIIYRYNVCGTGQSEMKRERNLRRDYLFAAAAPFTEEEKHYHCFFSTSYGPGKNSTNRPWSQSIYYRLSRLAFTSLSIHIVYDYHWRLFYILTSPQRSRLYPTSCNNTILYLYMYTTSRDILSSVSHYAFQIISRQVRHRPTRRRVVTSETIYSAAVAV